MQKEAGVRKNPGRLPRKQSGNAENKKTLKTLQPGGMSKKHATVLQKAQTLTDGARQSAYGPPSVSMTKIARLWRAYLLNKVEGTITMDDVPIMMALLKIAREQSGHLEDNLVDACGYLRIASMIAGDEQCQNPE